MAASGSDNRQCKECRQVAPQLEICCCDVNASNTLSTLRLPADDWLATGGVLAHSQAVSYALSPIHFPSTRCKAAIIMGLDIRLFSSFLLPPSLPSFPFLARLGLVAISYPSLIVSTLFCPAAPWKRNISKPHCQTHICQTPRSTTNKSPTSN